MRALLSIICAAVLIAQNPPPREETPVFRGGVSLVRVDTQVVEGRRAIASLERDDFRILEEGVVQKVEYFGRESEPLWLVLLLDVSGSMTKRIVEMAAVAKRALSRLAPEDQVAVLLFGRDTVVAAGFTADRDASAQAIAQAPRERGVGAGTAINVALMDASRYLRKQSEGKPGRRAIIILTDNGGLNYQASDQAALTALFHADAVLNAIVTPNAKPPGNVRAVNPDFSPSDVFKLARETGGEVVRAEKAGESFQDMLDRIRTRYSLHYRPAGATTPGLRRIQVELSPAARRRYPRAEIRARSGYAVN